MYFVLYLRLFDYPEF